MQLDNVEQLSSAASGTERLTIGEVGSRLVWPLKEVLTEGPYSKPIEEPLKGLGIKWLRRNDRFGPRPGGASNYGRLAACACGA